MEIHAGDSCRVCRGFLLRFLCGLRAPKGVGSVDGDVPNRNDAGEPRPANWRGYAVAAHRGLIFDSLIERDERMNPRGDLAESWETPDPRTYIFHLRRGVRF